MSFGQAISTCFRKYAAFSGRAQRSEYWWFLLFLYIVAIILYVIDGALGLQMGASEQVVNIGGTEVPFVNSGIGILSLIWTLVTLLPSIAVQVRRAHDSGKSGWLVLLGFVLLPVCGLGFILLLVLALLKSTRGDNRYGPETA
jgi:uncharacterized membrane protein YhaH (DUF805 family)